MIMPSAGLLQESAKTYESLAIDVKDGVAVVTLDRAKKQNALNMQLWEEIPHCFDACRLIPLHNSCKINTSVA